MPEFHMDYCFLGDKDGVIPLIVFVVRERLTRITMSSLVARKGAVPEVAARICNFFKEAGSEHADIILKNDQEDSSLVPVLDLYYVVRSTQYFDAAPPLSSIF